MVIDPCRRLVSEVRSLGTMPRNPDISPGFGKRAKLPKQRSVSIRRTH